MKLGIMPRIDRSSQLFRYLVAFVVVLGGTACASRLDTRGNLPDPERLAEIRAGQHTREEVSEILGSPSSVAVFDQETWYYVSERTATFAFFEPRVTRRKVVVLRFDEKGVVSDISTLGLKDGRIVKPVERETPTVGNELTFMDQLLGNLGRFNP